MKIKKEQVKSVIKEIIETIIFVVVMVIVIRFFIFELRWIPSASMKPTLIEGDRIFVEKFSRFYSTPKRGDIMVFYPPSAELKNDTLSVFQRLTGFFCKDIAYIKRVVGLPGDKISIKENTDGETFVYINGKKLDEGYILSDMDYIKCQKDMVCGPVTIPKDNYFMMGDNRGNSQDSRFWGFLPKDRFIGRAVVIFWPLNRLDHFEKQKY